MRSKRRKKIRASKFLFLFILSLSFSQETYLLELDKEPTKSKTSSNYERLGKSPFYILKSNTTPTQKHSKNQTYTLMSWHFDKVEAAKAHAVSKGKSDLIIGIIDSGTELDQAIFQENLWINSAEDINGNGKLDSLDLDGIDNDGNGYVDDVIGYDFVDTQNNSDAADFRDIDPFPNDEFFPTGHGALVHSLIRELAPASQIMTLRAADANGLLEEDDIARAIIYAAENGAKIVNLSFGNNSYSTFLESVIQYASNLGVIFVGASGNAGSDDIIYPAKFAEVIAVGNATEFDERSSSSNYGPELDLIAPGSSIETLGIGANTFSVSGTSFAAPMVSATISLIIDQFPHLSAEEIRHHLKITADDIGAVGNDMFTGAGRLNMFKAASEFSTNQLKIISPRHQAALQNTLVPIVISANGTHIRDLKISVRSGTQNIFEENLNSQFLQNDTIHKLDLSSFADGDYSIEISSTLFDGKVISEQQTFSIDREAPRITHLNSGKILNVNSYSDYIEVETDEATKLSLENSSSDLLAQTYQFESDAFIIAESTDENLNLKLSDRAANTASQNIAASKLAYWSPSVSFSSKIVLPYNSYVSSVTTDLNQNGMKEYWISKYRFPNSQFIDSLFIFEHVADNFVLKKKLPFFLPLRDAVKFGVKGKMDLLFSYAGVTELWEVDTNFNLIKTASTEIGLGTNFVPTQTNGIYDVLIRATDKFYLTASDLIIVRQTLTNPAANATVLGIPRSIVLSNNDSTKIYFSDANGNLIYYLRIGSGNFIHQNLKKNRYGGGVHNLAGYKNKIVTFGSALSAASQQDNSYSTRRRFLKSFSENLAEIDSLMFSDNFGDESNSFVQAFGNDLLVNTSGDLYLLDSTLNALALLRNVSGNSLAVDADNFMLSQNGEVRFFTKNSAKLLSVNSVKLSQPFTDSLNLSFTTASTYTKAYLYRSIAAASPTLFDSLPFPIKSKSYLLPSLNDSIRFYLKLSEASIESDLKASNALVYREAPKLLSFEHFANQLTTLEFDYAIEAKNLQSAFKLSSGEITSILQSSPSKISVFYRISKAESLSISDLKDIDGRSFEYTSLNIPYELPSASQRITGYVISSPTKVVVSFKNNLASRIEVKELSQNKAVKFSAAANSVTISNPERFVYSHHYQYSITTAGETYFVGFTNSTKIEETLFFPNPFLPADHEHVSITNIPEFTRLSIYNFRGQRILEKEFFQGEAHFKLIFQEELGYIPASGIYIYVLHSNSKTTKGKFTIVR